VGLAGAASGQLVGGVVHLRPEEAMAEAMLQGWRAQQTARGLRAKTIGARERLVRRFVAFTNEFPWQWSPGHVDEWTLTLTAEHHLAPAAIRGYQTELRLFSEYLTDARYGWAAACEREFGRGVHPVPICHEWNTIAHLNEYEGSPEARPFTREELQRFLDYADDQAGRAARAKRKGGWPPTGTPRCSGDLRLGSAAHRDRPAGSGRLGTQPGRGGVRPVRDAADGAQAGLPLAPAAGDG
jgi:integrase/recombinase XerC